MIQSLVTRAKDGVAAAATDFVIDTISGLAGLNENQQQVFNAIKQQLLITGKLDDAEIDELLLLLQPRINVLLRNFHSNRWQPATRKKMGGVIAHILVKHLPLDTADLAELEYQIVIKIKETIADTRVNKSLITAVRNGAPIVEVEALIGTGADADLAVTPTILHQDKTRYLTALLKAGVNPAESDKYGFNLLHTAAYCGNVPALKKLFDENNELPQYYKMQLQQALHAKVESGSTYGQATPLAVAIMCKREKAAICLLKAGARIDVIKASDRIDSWPYYNMLLLAIHRGLNDLINEMLDWKNKPDTYKKSLLNALTYKLPRSTAPSWVGKQADIIAAKCNNPQIATACEQARNELQQYFHAQEEEQLEESLEEVSDTVKPDSYADSSEEPEGIVGYVFNRVTAYLVPSYASLYLSSEEEESEETSANNNTDTSTLSKRH